MSYISQHLYYLIHESNVDNIEILNLLHIYLWLEYSNCSTFKLLEIKCHILKTHNIIAKNKKAHIILVNLLFPKVEKIFFSHGVFLKRDKSGI